MIPETHPLIEAATKPLADNAEQRLAANSMLEESTDTHHPDCEAVIYRWREVDHRKRRAFWIPTVHALAAIALIAFIFIGTSMNREFRLLKSISSFEPAVEAGMFKEYSQSELLLLGDPSLPKFLQKEALWRSDPSRADYYAEYAGAWFQEYSSLPPDYLETVNRIDPENAFFLYNAAGRNGADSVSKIKNTPALSDPPRFKNGRKIQPLPREIEWEVTDTEAFAEALEAIASGGKLPRFDSYETSMSAMRIALLDQSRLSGRLRALVYSGSQSSQVVSIRKVADVLSASAYLKSIDGDAAGFLRTRAMADDFLNHLSNSPPGSLVGELVFTVVADTLTRSIQHGAARLGMGELAKSLEAKVALFQEERDRKQMRDEGYDGHIEREGSALVALTVPMVKRQVANPPPLDRSLLTPGRRADHDFISASAISLIVAILLITSLCVLLFHLRAPGHVRSLAGRFSQLLDSRDWAWILGIGLVLPVAFVFSISWLTPLGGRSLGIRPMAFLFPIAHFTVLLLFLFSLPPLIIRWRVLKKTGPFGLDRPPGKLAFVLPVLGGLAALLLFPIMAWRILPQSALMPVAAIVVIWELAIMLGALRAVFGKRGKRQSRAVIAHNLPPVYSLSIVLLVSSIPLTLASANRWISKDELLKVVPTGFSQYEAEVAAQRRKETNAILGFE